MLARTAYSGCRDMEFVCGYSGSCFRKADFESGVHEEWVTKEKIIRNSQGGRDGMLQTTS
ncbi:hypothetical protein CUC01_07940 [Akkermansia muciniphila]|nr:hypothetical protein CUB96_04810 [Akkermansia muciniphila]AYR33026.1 hypothetical protein CUC01_07940 [Akkermansia muciniphila]MCO6192545.1 hypothetical protein [Akkermansia muciniphila]MCO6194470.1 hypothetical protein [Akkermansia muciniphila]MCO6196415.1 hypothetical protein [Akkermansia muciniphila]